MALVYQHGDCIAFKAIWSQSPCHCLASIDTNSRWQRAEQHETGPQPSSEESLPSCPVGVARALRWFAKAGLRFPPASLSFALVFFLTSPTHFPFWLENKAASKVGNLQILWCARSSENSSIAQASVRSGTAMCFPTYEAMRSLSRSGSFWNLPSPGAIVPDYPRAPRRGEWHSREPRAVHSLLQPARPTATNTEQRCSGAIAGAAALSAAAHVWFCRRLTSTDTFNIVFPDAAATSHKHPYPNDKLREVSLSIYK